MANDYGYFGSGSTGYAHYKQAVDHPTVRRILAENWQLRPAPPTYYQRYTITYNGETQRQDSKTARVYTVLREHLGGLLNDAAM